MLVLPASGQTPAPQQPPSHGQHGQQGQHQTGAQTSTQTDKQTTTGADESMVGQSDRQFMNKAAMSSMMEVQLADIAQEKAASSEVKEYAAKLKQDHQKANEQLKEIAEQRSVSLPTDMGKHQQQMQRLNNLSGEEFDRAYLKMQVDHHKKDIKEFQRQSNRGMDSNLKSFATAQLPVLQQHLEQAQQLSKSTGTRARSTDSTTDRSTDSSTDRTKNPSSDRTTNPNPDPNKQ
jgi:putative membrane protein